MHKSIRSAATRILPLAALTIICAVSCWAQPTEQILYTFTAGNDGGLPEAGLILDSKGNLYGTTALGGTSCCGTVFELTPNSNGIWTEQVLYSFTGGAGTGDGLEPYGGLIFDRTGNLYGTTLGGGSAGGGTVFELSPGLNGVWTEKVLYSFTGGSNCGAPLFGVILDPVGNLYGTTNSGGTKGFGCAFELVAGSNGAWSEKTLYSFTGENDGGYPYGSLVFDSTGNLYGSAQLGGAHDYGIVFEMSPQLNGGWREKVIHSFTGGAGGMSPLGTFVFDRAGNLYTDAISAVVELSPSSNGSWTAKNIHNFVGGSDGATAEAGLIIDKAGNLYGMTYSGGSHRGTVFELTPGSNGVWTEKMLHKFTGSSDGIFPEFANLVVDAQGNVYGTTPTGGAANYGVVFEVKP
jgi:uncharacterized repeat protein (TIGR03803 family)